MFDLKVSSIFTPYNHSSSLLANYLSYERILRSYRSSNQRIGYPLSTALFCCAKQRLQASVGDCKCALRLRQLSTVRLFHLQDVAAFFNSEHICSDKSSDQITFVTTLEEVRLVISYTSDMVNLERTTAYLWNLLKKPTLSAAERETIVTLFERYAHMALAPSTSNLHVSSLFPPLKALTNNEQTERDSRGHVNMLLAQHAMSQSDYAAAEKFASKVDAKSQQFAMAEMLLKKVSVRNAG